MGLFGWFRRKGRGGGRGPVADIRDRCGWWAEGDLALCINDAWGTSPLSGAPIKGEVYRVIKVDDIPPSWGPNLKAVWLYFPKTGTGFGFRADCFRKIVQQKDEATDGAQVPDWLQRLRERTLAGGVE